jgi:hypothetical protein
MNPCLELADACRETIIELTRGSTENGTFAAEVERRRNQKVTRMHGEGGLTFGVNMVQLPDMASWLPAWLLLMLAQMSPIARRISKQKSQFELDSVAEDVKGWLLL